MTMTRSEREMVRPLDGSECEGKAGPTPPGERFSSLQPTYEDSVVPAADDDWSEDEGRS